MAGKITDYNPLTSGFALTDLLELVDVSDTTLSVNGSNKKVTLGNLLANLPGATDAVSLGLSGASLTGSNASSLVDLAATWNTTGTPTAIKLNVTDTASNAESLLMDLQTGGTSRCAVLKSGSIRLRQYEGIGNDGSQGSKWTFNNGSAVLGKWDSTDYLKVAFNANTTTLHADHALCWGSSAVSSEDVFLYRDAAAVLALRNSTNAQAFRVYNTYTDASNNEYGAFSWNSNVLQIGSVNNGSGTARNVALIRGGTTMLTLQSNLLNIPSGVQLYMNNAILYGGATPTQMYAFRRKTETVTTNQNALAARSLATYTNEGASGAVTLTMDSLVAGYEWVFTDNNATHRLTVKPGTSDQIVWPDGTVVSNTTGSIVSTARYDSFWGCAVDATTFVVLGYTGTWTVTP